MEDDKLKNIYKKYPALKNLGEVTLKADTAFNSNNTGVGNIEYFSNDNEGRQSIIYPNGYEYKHPKPGTHGIVYDPRDNTEQSIALDMLHGMAKSDTTYNRLRNNYGDAILKSRFRWDLEREWENETAKQQPNDGKEQYTKNWIDGSIRNLLFEGTKEDFEKENYWLDAKKVYLSEPEIKDKFLLLEEYLKTGTLKVDK